MRKLSMKKLGMPASEAEKASGTAGVSVSGEGAGLLARLPALDEPAGAFDLPTPPLGFPPAVCLPGAAPLVRPCAIWPCICGGGVTAGARAVVGASVAEGAGPGLVGAGLGTVGEVTVGVVAAGEGEDVVSSGTMRVVVTSCVGLPVLAPRLIAGTASAITRAPASIGRITRAGCLIASLSCPAGS